MTRKVKTRKAAAKGRRRSTAKAKRSRPPVTGSKILEHLAAEHGIAALRLLSVRHPELVPEIEQIVRDLWASTTAEAIAERVVGALAQLTVFDLTRCDLGNPLGYRDETETAWGVVTAAIQPFVDSVHRLAKMGLTAAALIHCEGVLLGLYHAERTGVGELSEWVPDAPAELANEPLRALAPVRQKVVPDTGMTAGKALKEFAREHLREWTWLQK